MQLLIKTRTAALLLSTLTGLASAGASFGGAHLALHPAFGQQSAGAQTPPADKSGKQESESGRSAPTLPRLLLLVQYPVKAPVRRDDPILRFTDTLETALTASSKYEVIAYSPDHPSIKRAMLEHTLAVADTVTPIKQEALGRIAHAIGAHYALLLDPTFDRQGLAVDLKFLSDSDTNLWRTALTDRVVVENLQGRRLKPAAVMALAVDAITARVGAPSHLANGMKIAPDRLIHMAPKSARKETAGAKPTQRQDDTAPASPTPDSATVAKQNSGPQTGAVGTAPDASGAAAKDVNKRQNKSAAANKTRSATAANKNSRPATGIAQVKSPARPPTEDTSPETSAPAPRPDYSSMAQRYQASGDLASAILFWRRAIDLDPYNPDLRRHLVQAYSDRHMPDAARTEATRSLALLPDDVGLTHLYADTLVANGDIAGALKVYRDLTRRAPQDVTAQVALADALLADNQFGAAIDAYQAAVHIDAHSPLPHRRLARVYVGRADSDLQQYAESLKEITLARSLTPTGDTTSYESDYVPLMMRLDSRLHDLTDTLQDLYEAAIQGKKTNTELTRATTDLRERVTALADYLDALPPAAGQDDAHARYTQAAALLLQGVGTFRRYLTATNTHLEDARGPMQVARMDTLGALNLAGKRLTAAHNAVKGATGP